MPLHKVTNASRSQKKFVVAGDLDALKHKAAIKLDIPGEGSGLLVVFEADGTVIDDDEVLLELGKEHLMILSSTQSWTKDSQPTASSSDATEPTGSANSITYEIVVEDSHIPLEEDQIGTEVPVNHSNGSVRKDEDAYICLTLPNFSAMVQQHLKDNNIELVWNKLIGEAANHYYGQCPEESSAYQRIGQQMYSKYPSIKQEAGNYPWSFFTKCLSQKIRHMRHTLKRKSQTTVTSSSPGPVTKRFRPVDANHSVLSSKEDVIAHMEEIQDEWKKPSRNRSYAHLKTLLNETRSHRLELVKRSGRILKEAVHCFPCFQDGTYLLYEFKQTLGSEKLNGLVENIEVLVRACHILMGTPLGSEALNEDEQGSTDAVYNVVMVAFQHIENETKFDRGKKGIKHHLSAMRIHDGVADDKVTDKLKTVEGSPPTVVLFKEEGHYTGAYITGDEVSIKCYGDCLMVDILQLLAVYYIFDLDYPKAYAMFLGLLQQFVIEEPFTKESSNFFKFFSKKLRPVMEKIKSN